MDYGDARDWIEQRATEVTDTDIGEVALIRHQGLVAIQLTYTGEGRSRPSASVLCGDVADAVDVQPLLVQRAVHNGWSIGQLTFAGRDGRRPARRAACGG